MDDPKKTTPSSAKEGAAAPFQDNPQPASPTGAQPADSAASQPAASTGAQSAAEQVDGVVQAAAAPAANAEWRPVSEDPAASAAPPQTRPVFTPEGQQAAGTPQQGSDAPFPGAQAPEPQPFGAQAPGAQTPGASADPGFGTVPPQGWGPASGAVPPGSVPPGAVPPGAVSPPASNAYPPSMPPYGYQPPKQTSGKAVGALVCGILAILFCWTIVPSVILGIVAIVLAGKAVKESGKDGKTTGAKVCGIVGIVFSVLTLIAAILLGMLVGFAINEYDRYGGFSSGSVGASSSGGHHLEGGADSSDLEASEAAVTDAATAEMDKLVAKDATMVQGLARELDDEMRDSTEYLCGNGGISLTEAYVDPEELAGWMLDGMTYTVDEVWVYSSDAEADAYLTVQMRDLSAFSSRYQEHLAEALAGKQSVTLDEAKAAVSSSVGLAMSETTEYAPTSHYIEFERAGGSWVPDDSWYDDLVEYVF